MLLEINNLSGGYGKEPILKDVTFKADYGNIICLLGPNGCGKTTLFRLILGSIKKTSGKIRIDNKDIENISTKELANLVAYIPQYHSPIFSYTVLDIVTMGRASHFSSFEMPKAPDKKAAFEALEMVNALNLANKKYTSLSGGERQLVLIARAICQSAKVFLMDEPASNLDYANNKALSDLIISLSKKGYCIIISTHSPEQPFSLNGKVLLMKSGRVITFGDAKTAITSKSLKEVYGIDMDVIKINDKYGRERTICLPVDSI